MNSQTQPRGGRNEVYWRLKPYQKDVDVLSDESKRLGMKTNTFHGRRRRAAFTLMEMLVSAAIMGVVFLALYTGIGNAYTSIGRTREDLRATQILLEKAELLRLYTWSQVSTSTFPNFTVSYYPTTNGQAQGVSYTGTLTVTPLATGTVQDKKLKDENYAADMRLVTITLAWKTGNLQRQRSWSTLVAAKGVQNYVY